MLNLRSAAVVAALACGILGAQDPGGVIDGNAMDDRGEAVQNVEVRYAKLAEFSRDERGKAVLKDIGFQGSVTSDSEGRFRIPDLPPGRYAICAAEQAPRRLNACGWEPTATITVGPGEEVRGVERRLLEGVRLVIRVADAGGRIILADDKGRVSDPERRFFMGVVDSFGGFHPAEPVSQTASTTTFTVNLPKRETVRLLIDSDLRVEDATGKVVAARKPSDAVLAPSSDDELIVDLTVR